MFPVNIVPLLSYNKCYVTRAEILCLYGLNTVENCQNKPNLLQDLTHGEPSKEKIH